MPWNSTWHIINTQEMNVCLLVKNSLIIHQESLLFVGMNENLRRYFKFPELWEGFDSHNVFSSQI